MTKVRIKRKSSSTMNAMALAKAICKYILADSAFCWAFGLSSMLRHSLNTFLKKLKNRCSTNKDQDKIKQAEDYLNRLDFHKQLRSRF